jgi:hypothetical protein
VPVFVNEFWTAGQRRGHSLHEVSYRACFKPQLPQFFIRRLTRPGDRVHDPFMGRGTTPIEAALLGRVPSGSDINPLSAVLTRPRLRPPSLSDIEDRLSAISIDEAPDAVPEDLLAFYHPSTLSQLVALREYFLNRSQSGSIDLIDEFIRMVAINRLTGHSAGFFSVYTLPPNQATSVERQRRINEKRNQVPPERNVKELIVRKSRALLRSLTLEERVCLGDLPEAQLLTADAWSVPEIKTGSIKLGVTSPPFLDIVNYQADNWLRCWFAGIDSEKVKISKLRKIEDWTDMVRRTLVEQARLLAPRGFLCFEVGEVRNGTVKLEEQVLEAARTTDLNPVGVLINSQGFTKTSHLWGVKNSSGGTNTNRIVILQRA